MTNLLFLLFARFSPACSALREYVGGTRGAHLTKPRADRWAEALYRSGTSTLGSVRQSFADALVAANAWSAYLVDPWCPAPTVAPELAAATGSAAPVPATLAAVATALGQSSRRAVDGIAGRFSARWTEPDDARMAAGVFVGSLAIACAGLVVSTAVAAPQPVVHLQRLAAIVNLTDAPPAVAAAGLGSVGTAPADAPPPAEVAPPAEAATESNPATPGPKKKKAARSSGAASTATPRQAAAPVTTVPVPPPVPPAARGGLPIGKGMWIWMEDRAEAGDAAAIVARAKAMGLNHLYVRTGTLKGGFMGGPFLDRLLPVAHAEDIRVYGWDFPYLDNPGADVERAVAAISHTTPDGHRIDGFSADIETSNEGTNGNLDNIAAYCATLRQRVGANYPLIATVPNPTPAKVKAGYPYGLVVPHFDAVAPMVYWMNRDPGSDVANAVTYLSQFGKPVFPIGQAYDGAPEGGPPGVPGRDSIIRFQQFADGAGAAGVSFWSWQHATQDVWDAVRDAGEFRLGAGGAGGAGLTPGMVRSYQTVLTGLGFGVAADGAWGPATIDAVRGYQAAARLPVSGHIDPATRSFLLRPVAAPIAPL